MIIANNEQRLLSYEQIEMSAMTEEQRKDVIDRIVETYNNGYLIRQKNSDLMIKSVLINHRIKQLSFEKYDGSYTTPYTFKDIPLHKSFLLGLLDSGLQIYFD